MVVFVAGQHMERPPCVVSPGDALFHQHGHGAEVRFRGKRFQKGGRRGGDLLVTAVERHAKRKFSLSRGNAVKPSDTNSFTDFLT